MTPVPPVQNDHGDGAKSGGWLTRNLLVLSGVSLLQDAASELLYPILPLFLTQALGAPASLVGIIEGLAEGVASFTKIISGRLADRIRRRPLIAAGYGLAACAKAVIALATVWPVVMAGRCLDRVGKGIRGAPRDALLVEGISRERRGAAFGFHRMADTLGAVIGPAIGLVALIAVGGNHDPHKLRPLFAIAVIPATLSVALVAAVRERSGAASAVTPPTAEPHDVPLGGRFWAILVLLVAFSAVNFPDALLLLRAHSLGLDDASVVVAYIAYNVTYSGLSYPAGTLSDRLPSRLVFAAGLGFFAIGYLGLAFAHGVVAVFVVLCIYGGFQACTDGVGKAWISRAVPHERQGTAQGLYQGLTGVGVVFAGVWAGLLWGTDGAFPVVASGVCALAVAFVMLVARPLDS